LQLYILQVFRYKSRLLCLVANFYAWFFHGFYCFTMSLRPVSLPVLTLSTTVWEPSAWATIDRCPLLCNGLLISLSW
jgi:hypothetical protein